MKKRLIILFLVSIIQCGTCKAQNFWQSLNTPDSIEIFDITTSGSDIYLGTSDKYYGHGGIYRSHDEGQNWEKLEFPIPYTTSVQSVEVAPYGVIFAGSNAYRLFKSMDNGLTWSTACGSQDVFHIVKCGYDSIVLAGCGAENAIIRSGDYGQTWNDVLTYSPIYGMQWTTDFVFAENGIIYASSRNPEEGSRGIYRSLDLGLTWEYFGLNDEVYSLAMDNDENLLAGTLGGGLYRYNFNAQGWEWLVYSVTVKEILVFDSVIYLACDDMPNFNGGVLYSDDNGASFAYLNSGLGSYPSINAFAVTNDGYLLAAQYYDHKLYKSTEPIISGIREKNAGKSHFSCYPNPCQDYLTIMLSGNNITSSTKTEIRLINSLGKTAKQVNDVKNFPCSISTMGLPSGFYYVTITNESFQQTIKIIHY